MTSTARPWLNVPVTDPYMLLTNGVLLHLDPPRVERADVRIRGSRIVEVSAELNPLPQEECHDLNGRWVMPGLCVAHHHLYSALACGMPMPTSPPTNFTQMLKEVWWRLDRALNPESVEVSGLVGGLQALRAGVTTIIDHHASPNFIVGSLECLDGALDSLGLRRILCYEVSDRGGSSESRAGLAAHSGLLSSPKDGMRAAMIGAHANFTLSDESLASCASLAREAGVGLHIHVAEAVDDQATTGEALIARMERLGALVPGSIFAHCVHLSDAELRAVKDAGIWVTHQPRSNQNNGVGYANVAGFSERTALGTDGIGADLFAELQSGWFRAQEGNIPWSPERWLQMMSSGAILAGEALGVRLGRIEADYEADLTVLEPIPGPLLRSENLAAAFLFRLHSAAVREVLVAGQWRLRDRLPCGIDSSEIDLRAQREATALWARM